MATLRSFILAQSALPSGHTIREHITNPKTTNKVLYAGVLEITYMPEDIDIELTNQIVEIEISDDSAGIDIQLNEIDVEVYLG